MRRRKREAHEPGIGYADTLCEGLTNWHPLGRRPAAPTLGVCNQNPWSDFRAFAAAAMSLASSRRLAPAASTPCGQRVIRPDALQRRSRARKDGTHSTGIAPSGPRRCLVGWPSSICNRPFELAYGMGGDRCSTFNFHWLSWPMRS